MQWCKPLRSDSGREGERGGEREGEREGGEIEGIYSKCQKGEEEGREGEPVCCELAQSLTKVSSKKRLRGK